MTEKLLIAVFAVAAVIEVARIIRNRIAHRRKMREMDRMIEHAKNGGALAEFHVNADKEPDGETIGLLAKVAQQIRNARRRGQL